jgi:hypothetical protein
MRLFNYILKDSHIAAISKKICSHIILVLSFSNQHFAFQSQDYSIKKLSETTVNKQRVFVNEQPKDE